MVNELTNTILQTINSIAEKKVISSHSKPWVDKEIADLLKSLKSAKKKARRHRSPRNVKVYDDLLTTAVEKVSAAKWKWWKEQFELFEGESDKELCGRE